MSNLVRLMPFKDGIYPEIINTTVLEKPSKEEEKIRKFFEDTIYRANKYKEENHDYPNSIEDLISWEELQV